MFSAMTDIINTYKHAKVQLFAYEFPRLEQTGRYVLGHTHPFTAHPIAINKVKNDEIIS